MDPNSPAFWTDADGIQYFLDVFDLLYLQNKINKTPLKRAERVDLSKYSQDNNIQKE